MRIEKNSVDDGIFKHKGFSNYEKPFFILFLPLFISWLTVLAAF
jgi:hypothetical protein